jgi:phosphopantothenoylcysteine decarboxylase/phosphopantothenate--cysteine ligase
VIVDDFAPDNTDAIAHITFSQSVNLFLVVPATANIIAKFAGGIADDFVTTTYLASTAPVLIAPAMNTTMWEHPSTQRNLQQLREDGVSILDPDDGEMACGTIGPGRLSEPDRIVAAALDLLQSESAPVAHDLAGEKILITVGATREAIDPVRFISNRSSGKMGYAIARAARDRGAEVTVVAGHTTSLPPRGIRVLNVSSADEMHTAVMGELSAVSVFIGTAAVADYRPARLAREKIKKTEDSLILKLEQTKDILGDVSKNRHDSLLVVGFAAETESVLENATTKLHAKKLDAVVANDVSRGDAGFDSEMTYAAIIGQDDASPSLSLENKSETAERLLDEIIRLRRKSPLPRRRLRVAGEH